MGPGPEKCVGVSEESCTEAAIPSAAFGGPCLPGLACLEGVCAECPHGSYVKGGSCVETGLRLSPVPLSYAAAFEYCLSNGW